jgi:antitoxin MazE
LTLRICIEKSNKKLKFLAFLGALIKMRNILMSPSCNHLTTTCSKYKLCLNISQKSKEPIMAEAVLDIKQWGNNLGVRLPAAIAREAHLHADQRVRVSVKGNQVTITPVADAALTLAQRLAAYDPHRHGGEAMMPTENVGAERW